MRNQSRSETDEPATYRIQVRGLLGERWSEWTDDLSLSVDHLEGGQPVSTLHGVLADQAALHGLLQQLYALGFPLLSVQRIE